MKKWLPFGKDPDHFLDTKGFSLQLFVELVFTKQKIGMFSNVHMCIIYH